MPNISLDWNLASAKVAVDERSTQNVMRLKDSASHHFYQGGGYSSWVTHHRIDPQAFDVAFGKVRYERLLNANIDAAIAELTVDRALVRRVEIYLFGVAKFDRINISVERADQEKFSIHLVCEGETWKNDAASCELARAGMDLLNSHSHSYQPGIVDGIKHDFALIGGELIKRNRSMVKYSRENQDVRVVYVDDTLQVPERIKFFFEHKKSQKIVSVCEQLCDLFHARPSSIAVFDCPADHDKHNPLPPPTGAWSCEAWGSYRKGFDPLKRPASIDGSVRYPIWYCETKDFAKLLWHVDIVHTQTESFFDMQTSEGPEYLQQFLDEHGLVGEIWQGDFAERWNVPLPGAVLHPPHDELQTNRIIAQMDLDDTTSSLELEQVRIAKAYLDMMREWFNLKVDFTLETLKTLDDFIAKYYPQDCLFETTIDGVTACVGEIVRQSLSGQWAMSSKYPPGIAVDGTFANVRAWVEQRFHPDVQSSLVHKYQTYCQFLESKRQPNA